MIRHFKFIQTACSNFPIPISKILTFHFFLQMLNRLQNWFRTLMHLQPRVINKNLDPLRIKLLQRRLIRTKNFNNHIQQLKNSTIESNSRKKHHKNLLNLFDNIRNVINNIEANNLITRSKSTATAILIRHSVCFSFQRMVKNDVVQNR